MGTCIRLAAVCAIVAFATPAHAQETWDIAGKWRGGYICNQGLTALRVTITRDATGEGVTATFRFGPDAANPGVPRGVYRMRGQFNSVDKRLMLRGESWVERPAGYVMVDLDGLMRGSGLYISGDVIGPGCSRFDLVREGDDPIA